MFGIFKKKVDTEKVVNSAISGIDKLFYTNEEKADDVKYSMEYRMKLGDAIAGFYSTTLSENSERSKFRRRVGLQIIWVYTLLTASVIAAHFFGTNEDVKFLIEIMKLWSFGFGSVIVFLFGGYYLNMAKPQISDFINNIKKKKKDA